MHNWKTADAVPVEIGVHDSVSLDSGWWRILEQEGIPHRTVSSPEAPIILFEETAPDWIEDYLNAGGVAVITDAEPEALPFQANYQGNAVVHSFELFEANHRQIHAPCHAKLFRGSGEGQFRIHRARATKNGIQNGVFPALLERRVGEGVCLFTGIPLTKLLTMVGDNLRRLGPHSDVTERITDIDKWKVADALVHFLRRAFAFAGLPRIGLCRFPKGARSVFIFRVDVDGTFGDNLRQLRDSSLEFGLPTVFFLNRSLCEGDEELLATLRAPLEVGNHGDVHNLFDDPDSNLSNLQRCENWLDSLGVEHGRWYAAPRGMWNFALGQALDESGFEFSSDFGLDADGLPFFPRFRGKRLNALQLPVHAYSPERASKFAQENGLPEPRAEDVLEYFVHVAREKIERSLPVYLYAHPEVFGPMAHEVLGELAAFLKEKEVPILSLSEYARFWRSRDSIRYDATLIRSKGAVYVSHRLPEDMRIVVDGAVIDPETKEIRFGHNGL